VGLFEYCQIAMQLNFSEAEQTLAAGLRARKLQSAPFVAHSALWLEACKFPGLHCLYEALGDKVKQTSLQVVAHGIDLHHVSCVFIAEQVFSEIRKSGRATLRNVRHGLFLLPASAESNVAIGCPIDNSFSLGGERSGNPYTEKVVLAKTQGLTVNEVIWNRLMEISL
jgi:hypothetical protein